MTPQAGGIMLDTPQSVSPALIKAAPMAKTAVLPSSVMNVRPQSAVQGLNWTQIPGSASAAAAAPDGSLWVLSNAPAGADKYIWHYVSGTWTNISGLARRLSVAPNGTLYAINSGGGTYSYSGGIWTALGGGASDITIAADESIYVLSNGNAAGSDQAIWHYTSGWSQVPGSGVKIAASWDTNNYTLPSGTVSADGLYILNSIGSIYHENTDNSFVQLPGNASAIAPATTTEGLFALGYPISGNGNSIYYYDLVTPGWSAGAGSGVSISTDGSNLYVIGTSGGIYSSPVRPAGGTITEYPTNSGAEVPQDITAGPDGNLWFTEQGGSSWISKMTPTGVVTDYPIPVNPAVPPGPGASPNGIVTGPDGNLWFTENNYNAIGKMTPSGQGYTEYPLPTGTPGQNSAQPWEITAGPDGNLWFTENAGNKIGRITRIGVITEYPLPGGAAPQNIAAGPDGNLWFTEPGLDRIGKITTSGTITEYPIAAETLASYDISDIAAGPDGNLWFTDGGSPDFPDNKIGKITTSGTITMYSLPTTAYAGSLSCIAAGPDGNLWFTEGYKIGKITPSGYFTEYPLPTTPYDITAAPDGNLWFTERGVVSGAYYLIGKITP
jgi:streptogramin lyase